MANTINILKPSACFEVQRIIGISATDGNCKTYHVQWAPSWISGVHLIGCEDLIEQFEHELEDKDNNIKVELVDVHASVDGTGLEFNINYQDGNQQGSSHNLQDDVNNSTTDPILCRNQVSHPRLQLQNPNANTNVVNADVKSQNGNDVEQYVNRNTLNPAFQSLDTNGESLQDGILSFQSDLPNGSDTNFGENVNINGTFVISETTDYGHSKNSLPSQPYFNTEHRNRENVGEPLEQCNADNNTTDNGNNLQQIDLQTYDIPTINRREFDSSCRIKGEKEPKSKSKVDKKKFELKTILNSKYHPKNNSANKKIPSKVKIQKHEVNCNGEKEYSCNICTEKFTDYLKLQAHKQTHATKARPYKCSYCEKTFLNTTDIKRHTRVHTGERPFQCNVCQKGFKIKHNLQRHFKTHVQERPSMCGSV